MGREVSWPVLPQAERKRGFLVGGDACRRDVGIQVGFGVMVGGHLVPLTALLM